jgi:hypothetical protein
MGFRDVPIDLCRRLPGGPATLQDETLHIVDTGGTKGISHGNRVITTQYPSGCFVYLDIYNYATVKYNDEEGVGQSAATDYYGRDVVCDLSPPTIQQRDPNTTHRFRGLIARPQVLRALIVVALMSA